MQAQAGGILEGLSGASINAEEIIRLLDLRPLPVEGGHFRQSYRSGIELPPEALPPGVQGPHPLSTTIYYLLTSEPDSYSALHRLPSDEVWHFYLGDPVELLMLYPDGSSRLVELGSDLGAGHQVQLLVPAEVWQGARLVPGGELALMGTTMAPGFIDSDYEQGDPEGLAAKYSEQAERIQALTR